MVPSFARLAQCQATDTQIVRRLFQLVRGLYIAANGAVVATANVDVIANNIANTNTNGFKRTFLQVESIEKAQIYRFQTENGIAPGSHTPGQAGVAYVGPLGFGSRIYDTPDTPTVFEQGPTQTTNNPFDFSLEGKGFFTVRNTAGQLRYTRDGGFVRDNTGRLTTANGDAVVGQNGNPIQIPDTGAMLVDRSGNITVAGRFVDQIQTVEFRDTRFLRSEGSNRFIDGGAGPIKATGSNVLQGTLEKSNANVVRSMVDLIAAERWFDANEKMIQSEDEATNLAISGVGHASR